ncbi:MAG: lysophospholipid acyltransferase family protein, partial [Planctomycetota bacterium]
DTIIKYDLLSVKNEVMILFRLISLFFFKLAVLIFHTFFRIRNNIRFEGLENISENISENSPLIIASNHASYLDPVVISLAVYQRKRIVYWLAWDALFKVPVLSFFIRMFGAIPVKPDSSGKEHFRKAEEILKNNGVIGIFPEGGRSKDGNIGEIKPGFVKLAFSCGAKIIPALVLDSFAVWSLNKFLPGGAKLTIRFLPPVKIDKNEESKETRKQICITLRKLFSYNLKQYRVNTSFIRTFDGNLCESAVSDVLKFL